jgi:hypothetical protein
MNQEVQDRIEELLQALHAAAGKSFGSEKWDRACDHATSVGLFADPRSDTFTRTVVEQADPYLVLAIAKAADRLMPFLSQFQSDEKAAEWIVKHREELTDILDDDEISQSIYESRRNRGTYSQPTEQQKYEQMRAKQGAYWARGRGK